MKHTTLATAQNDYKRAVEAWIFAIRAEECLISADSSLAQIDTWQGAHFREGIARDSAKLAKKEYEEALRHAISNGLSIPSEKAPVLPR
jgi:hypothetical protein